MSLFESSMPSVCYISAIKYFKCVFLSEEFADLITKLALNFTVMGTSHWCLEQTLPSHSLKLRRNDQDVHYKVYKQP